ncbi:MAG: PatB family C-S lyase [Bacteroidota bacterium]
MNHFDTIHENFEHKFAKQNSNMLRHMFGSDDVSSFWIADMDFPIAKPITDELKRIADRSIYAYEFDRSSIFKAIVDWNEDRHGLVLNRKSFVQVTGVLTGIAVAIRELTDPNDGILIQTPVYHQFAKVIKTAGRKIVRNPLQIVNGKYEMDFEDFEEKLRSKNVKVILLCNPHNPVGRVWKREELQKMIDIAEAYGVTIISDEIHSDIIYSGNDFNSITSLGVERHISLIGSPAKTFGMQSISNGYLYIPNEEIRSNIKKEVESMYLNHGNAFTTFATIAAFKGGGPWVDELIAYLEKSILWIQNYLETELPMIKMLPIEGTYQIWLDFSELDIQGDELNKFLVKKAKLALTPGGWFDRESGRHMRMNIASPLSKIQLAFKQLRSAINEGI